MEVTAPPYGALVRVNDCFADYVEQCLACKQVGFLDCWPLAVTLGGKL